LGISGRREERGGKGVHDLKEWMRERAARTRRLRNHGFKGSPPEGIGTARKQKESLNETAVGEQRRSDKKEKGNGRKKKNGCSPCGHLIKGAAMFIPAGGRKGKRAPE